MWIARWRGASPDRRSGPFVYAEVFQRRLIRQQGLSLDAPVRLASGRAVYQPQDFDHRWHGWVGVREALGSAEVTLCSI